MRQFFCATIALLLAVGLAQSGDNAGKKAEEQPEFCYGVMESLDVKEGVGTLTILGVQRKSQRPKVMRFALTKDTKFYKGGTAGRDDRPGTLGDPVDPANVSEAYRRCRFLWVLFTREGDKMTATVVNVTA